MTSWKDVTAEVPDLAARAEALFRIRKHMTLATLRIDGSPRISGTEVQFVDGELVVGMSPESRKALDLRRDPRLALHCPTEDAPDEHQSTWPGDAKVAGVAVARDETTFAIDITELVLTKIADTEDCLLIESWHPGRGRSTYRR
jgi:hypothetical protein